MQHCQRELAGSDAPRQLFSFPVLACGGVGYNLFLGSLFGVVAC